MRTRSLRILGLCVAIGLAAPLFAQRPMGGFGGGLTGTALLTQKSVQEELKLTDDQITKVKKVADDQGAKMKDLFAEKDKDKRAEAMKTMSAETTKALAEVLKPEQSKRLKQIEIQLGGLQALSREEVAKELKLTDKQKDDLKGRADDLNKDRADLMKDAGRDPAKMAEVMTKVRAAGSEAATKFVSTLTDDQKAAYKEMTGKKFEGKIEATGMRRPPAKDKE